MEPIDSSLEYRVQTGDPRARFKWLYIFPTLGVLFLVFLVSAVFLQWPIGSMINSIMTFMLVYFVALALVLFWVMAPKANRS